MKQRFLSPAFRTAILSALALCLTANVALAQAPSTPGVNRNAAIAADFDKRVTDYMKLRQKAQSGLAEPKNTDSAEKISQYQHELADRIRSQRADAKPGEIFTPEISGLFRRLVHQALDGPDGEQIRKSYAHAEPLHGLRLDVNQAYPDATPLQSMPPSLLLNLPKLPKELEYRFVGRELLLRDTAANLVVDVVPDLSTAETK